MVSFIEELARRVLLCDGAIGTMLHAAGHSFDGALATLNLANPALVSTVHDSYVAAGADVIQTNTFGASRLRLASYGRADGVRDINVAGAQIARDCRVGLDRQIWVAGSVSPAVTMAQRARIEPDERALALREQIEALVDGGVDLLLLETFGYLDELVQAVEVAGEYGLPVVAQATFGENGLTASGSTPADVARQLAELPLDVIGANCTLGPSKLVPIVQSLAEHGGRPVSVQPNAGRPLRSVDDQNLRFTVDVDYFASFTPRFIAAGAALIGGCCGTTPATIRAIAGEMRRDAGAPPSAHWSRPVAGESAVSQRPAASAPAVLASVRPSLRARVAEDMPLLAVEMVPPVAGAIDEALDRASRLHQQGVDMFLVRCDLGLPAQISPLSLAVGIRQRTGAEPLLSVASWERSVIALQADMLGSHALDVRNIVAETPGGSVVGDYPLRDLPSETNPLDLVALLAGLNQGRDCNGLPLRVPTSFVIGATWASAGGHSDAPLTAIRRGAQFLVTTPVYDAAALRRSCETLRREQVPVLVTTRPLRSLEEAAYLHHEVPAANVPAAVLERMSSAVVAREAGVEIAMEVVRTALSVAAGVVLAADDDDALDHLVGLALDERSRA